MKWRLYAAMAGAVVAIWLLGTWVTRYSLEEMAIFAPIAVLALGALAGIVLLWTKVIVESVRRRRDVRPRAAASASPAAPQDD